MLSAADCEVLIEAMGFWAERPGKDVLTEAAEIVRREGPGALLFGDAGKKLRARDEGSQRVRDERATLIKAKLIQMRDSAVADETTRARR